MQKHDADIEEQQEAIETLLTQLQTAEGASLSEAWHRRGLCEQLALGRPEDAQNSFEAALGLNPRHYPTMLSLAKLLLRRSVAVEEEAEGLLRGQSSRERAVELLEEAVNLNPGLRPEVEALL